EGVGSGGGGRVGGGGVQRERQPPLAGQGQRGVHLVEAAHGGRESDCPRAAQVAPALVGSVDGREQRQEERDEESEHGFARSPRPSRRSQSNQEQAEGGRGAPDRRHE